MSEQHANFRRLIAGLDVRAARAELASHPQFWSMLQLRQMYEGSAHVDTETIAVRGPDHLDNIFDNLDCLDYELLQQLPVTLGLIQHAVDFLKAREIGRIMIVRLAANGWIRPHVDEGAYARYYARFHLVIETNEDCIFKCGEDRVHMAEGELWWFNHQRPHSVLNRGPARTHLIMDFTAPGFTGALEAIRVPE